MNSRRLSQNKSYIAPSNENRSLSFSKEPRNAMQSRYHSSNSFRAFGRDISNLHNDSRLAKNSLLPQYQSKRSDAPKSVEGRLPTRTRTYLECEDKKTLDAKKTLQAFKSALEKEKQKLWPEDQPDFGDPQACTEYLKEISDVLHKTQCQFQATPNYMQTQKDVNEKMRAILVDWLIEVHLKFKLLPETLFLTVNLIDRYLAKE